MVSQIELVGEDAGLGSTPVKLHLGCGSKVIDGFVHIDILDLPHLDYRGRVDDLRLIKSGSVDLIYASHLLEHFGKHEVSGVLKEWARVLKPGGVLRIAVPDLGACAKLYCDGVPLDTIFGLIYGGQRDEYDYHKSGFDEARLTSFLKEAGFREVRKWDWRTTEHAHIDDYSQAYLPHMDKKNGRLVSLNLEGVK